MGNLTHADPHFITHQLTGKPWCVCPCSGCTGHVEGLEGMDCQCGGCSCSLLLSSTLPARACCELWRGHDGPCQVSTIC
jgi:hypothetical protein